VETDGMRMCELLLPATRSGGHGRLLADFIDYCETADATAVKCLALFTALLRGGQTSSGAETRYSIRRLDLSVTNSEGCCMRLRTKASTMHQSLPRGRARHLAH
jgi:hypothetical protein